MKATTKHNLLALVALGIFLLASSVNGLLLMVGM